MEESITSMLAPAPNGPEANASQANQGTERQIQLGLKRVLDIVASVGFLLLFFPLLAGVVLLLLLVQGRPVLFKHSRIGKDGKAFNCFKFRTMVNDSGRALDEHLAANPAATREWEASRKLKEDPRVTALGRVMRKGSIDELPQFLNVVRGEMSLVGPRPIVASEVHFYGPQIAYYKSRRPGITGPWQVSGRSNTAYARRVQLDVEYVQNWSLATDVVILLKTVPAVISSDGSC